MGVECDLCGDPLPPGSILIKMQLVAGPGQWAAWECNPCRSAMWSIGHAASKAAQDAYKAGAYARRRNAVESKQKEGQS